MVNVTENREPKTAAGDRVVLMYPGNRLKKQVRAYDATPSTLKVVKEAFFKG